MGIDRAAIFNKIASASASGGGNYMRDGKYLVAVWGLELASKFSGPTHIAELEVLEAEASGEKDAKGNPVEPNAVGTRMSWVQLLDKHISAAGNVKAFYLALDGCTESEMPMERLAGEYDASGNCTKQGILDIATGKAQPFRGMKIRIETYRKDTKDKSKTLVLPRWSFVSQTPEEVESMRHMLESAEAKKPQTPAPAAAK